jgi:hydroxymethylpyrimidine/phosphomethylpyrimidine kinase
MSDEPAKVLTIAGSDSGGAAGLQADLKTFTALGVYGMSVVTAVTAQNSHEVRAVHFLPAAFVVAQLEAVLSDYGAGAIKTGFIGNAALIAQIAGMLTSYGLPPLVVDPVLVNHRGEAMFGDDVPAAYLTQLAPLARLITPNAREASLLADMTVDSVAAAGRAAAVIRQRGAASVLITGIVAGVEVIDLLDDGEQQLFRSPRIATGNMHGSGDTLSAAVTAFLAQGDELLPAIEQARAFTNGAIRRAAGWRLGAGHGPLAHFR